MMGNVGNAFCPSQFVKKKFNGMDPLLKITELLKKDAIHVLAIIIVVDFSSPGLSKIIHFLWIILLPTSFVFSWSGVASNAFSRFFCCLAVSLANFSITCCCFFASLLVNFLRCWSVMCRCFRCCLLVCLSSLRSLVVGYWWCVFRPVFFLKSSFWACYHLLI